jgi:PhnB protein
MKTTNITLAFNGNAEEAFNFYKSVFGGQFIHVQRMSDIPGDHSHQMAPGEANRILHMALPIGSAVLSGMDVPVKMPASVFGTNFMVQAETESEAETDKIYNGLAEGGRISIALGHQFWGSYFGMLTDKFGIQWMVSYTKQQ